MKRPRITLMAVCLLTAVLASCGGSRGGGIDAGAPAASTRTATVTVAPSPSPSTPEDQVRATLSHEAGKDWATATDKQIDAVAESVCALMRHAVKLVTAGVAKNTEATVIDFIQRQNPHRASRNDDRRIVDAMATAFCPVTLSATPPTPSPSPTPTTG